MDAIQKIRSFERFGSRLGLERMEKLMERLGNPQDGMNFIHVAGTNGKGSVCRFIYEALKENGYNAGIYTSPYVEAFNERIEFDGLYITDEDLQTCTDEVLAEVKEITEMGFDSPTEFEIVTAVAFVYFKKKEADYVVLEVGLGGRGDSTNIIKKPLISIITSISFDHMDRLGDTIELIAGEKAGIIKEGIPVVSNVDHRDAVKVIARTAGQFNAQLYDVTKIKYGNVKKAPGSYLFDANIYETEYNDVEITMIGGHQLQNALTALTAIEILRKKELIKIKKDDLYRGLKNARQLARFEIFGKDPYFIIDGAHNEKGAEALKITMREHFADKKILLVTGMLQDKDVKAILKHFYEITGDFIATEPENIRKLPAEDLKNEICSAGKKCIAVADVVSACKAAIKLKDKYDVILFTGSLYLLGKIRGIIRLIA